MSRLTRFIVIDAVIMAAIALVLLFYFRTPDAPAPQPAPPIPEPTAAAKALPPVEVDLILDLFEPTPESLDAQHSAQALRGQIEQALVATFLLTKCHYFSQQEYADTYNALIRYALRSQLSPDIATAANDVRALASSAGASYSLIYSRVPCSDASLAPLAESLRKWQQ